MQKVRVRLPYVPQKTPFLTGDVKMYVVSQKQKCDKRKT